MAFQTPECHPRYQTNSTVPLKKVPLKKQA